MYLPLPLEKTRCTDNKRFAEYKDNPLIFSNKYSPLRILSYGSIYDRRMIPFLLNALSCLSLEYNIDVEFILAGRDATSAQNIDELCSKKPFKIERYPYLSDSKLSDVLDTVDLGVCLSDQDGLLISCWNML